MFLPHALDCGWQRPPSQLVRRSALTHQQPQISFMDDLRLHMFWPGRLDSDRSPRECAALVAEDHAVEFVCVCVCIQVKVQVKVQVQLRERVRVRIQV